MFHDRMDSVPAAGRGLFISGIVLGLAIGFAAGHLLLFARSRSTHEAHPVVSSFPPFDPTAEPYTINDVGSGSDDIAFSVLELEGPSDVGRVRLSDDDSDDGLHYFPDATSRDFDVAQDSRLAFADGRQSPAPAVTAELSTQDGAPPNAIEPAPTAAPIDAQTKQRERLARSIIQEELPDATPQELEIWCDVLQGLPAEDIKGIIRMRKRFGTGGSSTLGRLDDAAPPLIQPDPAEPSRLGPAGTPPIQWPPDQLATLQQLRDIARHNYANRDTVAFKQIVPVLTEAKFDGAMTGSGAKLVTVTRDMRPGSLEQTGRALDVAIEGTGFLQVRRGDDVRFTRDGRLQLDEHGRLKLIASDQAWLIDPPVSVPLAAAKVEVTASGEVLASGGGVSEAVSSGRIRVVQFLNPESLNASGAGLFAETNSSGKPQTAESADFVLRQGFVEVSNVDADHVLRQLNEHQSLIDVIEE